VVRQVLQAGLRAPVVFAGHEDEGVRGADLFRKRFHRRGRGAFGVLLVHAVEHRQVDGLGVDELRVGAARAQARHDEVREPHAHAVRAVRAIEHQDLVSHR
jgi:outer membrane PBP1 activator LpoA protein